MNDWFNKLFNIRLSWGKGNVQVGQAGADPLTGASPAPGEISLTTILLIVVAAWLIFREGK